MVPAVINAEPVPIEVPATNRSTADDDNESQIPEVGEPEDVLIENRIDNLIEAPANIPAPESAPEPSPPEPSTTPSRKTPADVGEPDNSARPQSQQATPELPLNPDPVAPPKFSPRSEDLSPPLPENPPINQVPAAPRVQPPTPDLPTNPTYGLPPNGLPEVNIDRRAKKLFTATSPPQPKVHFASQSKPRLTISKWRAAIQKSQTRND